MSLISPSRLHNLCKVGTLLVIPSTLIWAQDGLPTDREMFPVTKAIWSIRGCYTLCVMNTATINIVTESGMRASEIIADLRNASEILYYPMRLVGFRDYKLDLHLCPQEQRREECPHGLAESDPRYVDYEAFLERSMHAKIRLDFPHADISIYLG